MSIKILENYKINEENIINGKKCIEKALTLKSENKFKEAISELRKGIDEYCYHGCWLELKKNWVLDNVKFTEKELLSESNLNYHQKY
jgi:uncharacterized protein YutD